MTLLSLGWPFLMGQFCRWDGKKSTRIIHSANVSNACNQKCTVQEHLNGIRGSHDDHQTNTISVAFYSTYPSSRRLIMRKLATGAYLSAWTEALPRICAALKVAEDPTAPTTGLERSLADAAARWVAENPTAGAWEWCTTSKSHRTPPTSSVTDNRQWNLRSTAPGRGRGTQSVLF